MPESTGSAAQTRIIAEQVAEAAITRFAAEHPEIRKPEVPAPLKWAAGIIATLFTMAVGGMAVWLVTTVNEMQVTIARIDERMEASSATLDSRLVDHDRRLQRLEQRTGEH